MNLLNRKKLSLSTMSDIENAVANSEQNSLDVNDITAAIIELSEMLAEHDDALVELAELLG